uniref:BAG domain-containing protein n=1 Tax=Timema tahoe TaxID=61484 RepID=A0A7R9IRH8_9NEOP|nr:unnamed protein product [Timema tahoe]
MNCTRRNQTEKLEGASSPRLSESFAALSDTIKLKEAEDRAIGGLSFTDNRNGPVTFPFDDMPRGRQDIRSHLDDLAQRHPEFADHLRCPPGWGGEIGSHSPWGKKRRGSESCGDDDARSQASGASSSGSDVPQQPMQSEFQEQTDEPGPLRGRASRQGNLPQYGMRNTVDMGQQQHAAEQNKESRGQRSMSAPPDNRSQNPEQPARFVSRINITPVNSAEPATKQCGSPDAQGKPPVAPKPPHQQQIPSSPKPTPKQQGSNIRHIPIFVEGRDEPVLPKNISEPSYIPKPSQFHQTPHPSHSYGTSPKFTSHHQFQPRQPSPPPASQPKRPSAPQSQQPPQPKAPTKPQQEPPKPPEGPSPNDPISRVMIIQKDVDDLMKKVEEFRGNSRSDKEYIYLDEMLTRNLLKLDDIETEGKENVRQARKEVIRSIQKGIGILEERVPLPEEKVGVEVMETSEENRDIAEEGKEERSAASGQAEPESLEVSQGSLATESPKVCNVNNQDEVLESSVAPEESSDAVKEVEGKSQQESKEHKMDMDCKESVKESVELENIPDKMELEGTNDDKMEEESQTSTKTEVETTEGEKLSESNNGAHSMEVEETKKVEVVTGEDGGTEKTSNVEMVEPEVKTMEVEPLARDETEVGSQLLESSTVEPVPASSGKKSGVKSSKSPKSKQKLSVSKQD